MAMQFYGSRKISSINIVASDLLENPITPKHCTQGNENNDVEEHSGLLKRKELSIFTVFEQNG